MSNKSSVTNGQQCNNPFLKKTSSIPLPPLLFARGSNKKVSHVKQGYQIYNHAGGKTFFFKNKGLILFPNLVDICTKLIGKSQIIFEGNNKT